QKRWNDVVNNLIAKRRRLDWKSELDSPVKIARHPVRAGKENPRLPGIFKVENPAMLEKSANDADDTNVFAQTRNLRTQATDPPPDQINGYIGAGSFIEFLDDLLIDQRVHLRHDSRRLSCQRVVALPLDQLDEPAVQVERGDHQFLQARITSEARQRVENGCHLFAQLRFAGKQAEI